MGDFVFHAKYASLKGPDRPSCTLDDRVFNLTYLGAVILIVGGGGGGGGGGGVYHLYNYRQL